jgi:hypothetical protein
MADLILKAILSYIQKHPEVIEQLVEKLINEILKKTA